MYNIIPAPYLTVIDGTIKTTSRDVAEKFGKRHDHVIRDIEDLEIPEDFRIPNFGETYIETKMPNGGIRKDKVYEMTRDGFTILAMGFTGSKAMEWKIKYLTAFKAMEHVLIQQQQKVLSGVPTLTPAQQRQVQRMVIDRAWAMAGGEKPDKGTFQKVYRTIKDHFMVAKYTQVPQSRFDELVTFLGGTMPLDTPMATPIGADDRTMIWERLSKNAEYLAANVKQAQDSLHYVMMSLLRMRNCEALLMPDLFIEGRRKKNLEKTTETDRRN